MVGHSQPVFEEAVQHLRNVVRIATHHGPNEPQDYATLRAAQDWLVALDDLELDRQAAEGCRNHSSPTLC